MNRIPGIFGVAALIFTLGIFSGNIITLPASTSAKTQNYPESKSSQPDPLIQLASLPDEWAMGDEPNDVSSFAQFAESNSAASDSSILLASATQPSDAADAMQIRQAIVEEFPDIDQATLDGWVAGYAGTPLEVLQPLLQQKKLMPSIVPSRSFSELDGFSGTAQTQSANNHSNAFCDLCKKNLDNTFTIGYRRQTQFARLVEITSAASDDLELLSNFDFNPGQLQTSNSVLHLAIDGNPNLFFQLTPGNILTRCGAFERLDDGRVGVLYKQEKLVLSGTSELPLEATNVAVSADGKITYNDVERELQSAGQITLVEVKDLSRLASQNGVYFTTADVITNEVADGTEISCITAGALELSNVDSDAEWKYLEHFQRLGERTP